MALSLPQSMCSSLSASRSLPQTCTVVSAAPQFDHSITHSCSILNAPPSLQVLLGACENALAQSESTLQSSRGGWEHLGVLRSSGEGYQSVWEGCVWLPDLITFCWWTLRDLTIRIFKFRSSWDRCTALRETWCRILKAVVLRVP